MRVESPKVSFRKGTYTSAILRIGLSPQFLSFFFPTFSSSFLMCCHVPYSFSSSCPSAGGFADTVPLFLKNAQVRDKLWRIPTFVDTKTLQLALSPSFYSENLPKHIFKVIHPSNVMSTFSL